jgi:pyrroline-5-carboxylate reductase
MKLAFIGAGRMATAIARGLLDKQVVVPDDVKAVDVSAEARERFSAMTGADCLGSARDTLAGADTVLLAVKPQVAEQVVQALAGMCTDKLLISIMAGVPLSRLCTWLGSDRVVRVMPNTPLTVARGASAFACAAGVSAADRALTEQVFASLGLAAEVEEGQLDAVTALSGSGPAYVFEFVQALADAGVAAGLPAELALDLTVQTVAGAAEMLSRKLDTPDNLRIAVTSPGGTTAAGLAVLDTAGFRDLVRAVVTAARDRSVELGKGAG